MRIVSVRLHNFGLYCGDHKIIFEAPDSSRNVTLIGGLNGRGKTTLLDSITLGLYGRRALRFLQDERIAYAQYLYNHINKSTLSEETFIEITLADAVEGVGELCLRRGWSLDKKGIAQETFTVFRENHPDPTLSENWDYYVEEILPLNISRFFIFDGEKIATLADEETFESVKESIQALLGLTTIDTLIEDLEHFISSSYQKMEVSEASDLEHLLKENDEELSSIRQEGEKLTLAHADMDALLAKKQSKYDALEHDFWDKGGNLGLQKEEMQNRRAALIKRVDQLQEQVTTIVESAMTPFLVSRKLLLSTYDSAVHIQENFSLDQTKKVLKYMSSKLESSERTLSEIQVISTFLDSVKDELVNQSKELEKESEITPSSFLQLTNLVTNLQKEISHIDELHSEIASVNSDLSSLEVFLSFEATDNDVREIWTQLQGLSREILDLKVSLKSNEENQLRLQNRLDSLIRHRESLHKQELKSGQLLDQRQRMIAYAAKSIQVMGSYRKKIQESRVKALEKNIYQCFTYLMQKREAIQGVTIHPETLDIHLIDYNGQELRKDQLSAGEKQLLAISIIWGLARSSGYDMPVIVDTPLGRLDSNHRTNFVVRYLPAAGKQVIVLSTDEEVNGRYYEMLSGHIASVYTLVYNETSHSTSIQAGYFDIER